MEEHLKANAELVREIARDRLGVDVDYDEDGVRWLNSFIDGQREQGDPETRKRLPGTLGSFLGECVRHTFGGTWVQHPDYGWGVEINDKVTVFPFNKVEKQLEAGEGDTVLSFFKTLPAVLEGLPRRK